MKGKIPLAEAQRIAWDWVRVLAPDCERIEVAGSIRRKCETVGDVEIAAILTPGKPEQVALLPGLAGTEKQKLPPLFERIHDLENFRNGTSPILVTKGTPGLLNGQARYLQIYDRTEKIYLDLFLATKETWGVIFTIRTGSAEFSHGLMLHANRIGLTSYQGRLVPAAEVIRGKNGKPKAMGLAVPFETPEERDVFEALKIQWIEPEERHGVLDIKPLSRRSLDERGEDGPS